jgi:predicted ATPase/class 3 adenylate cyclase
VRSDLPSGTVTFLFTDVEGSTRLLEELGAEAYAAVLADHRRVVRDAFARHEGVEVDTQGDAFFVAFPTASGALRAAAEICERLEAGPIRLRMGVHTGTPLLGDEGYVGHDVHRAARIAAAGHGGQVLVSASTAALADVDELRDLGEHRLKDLSAPERIYQLGGEEFPPLATLYRTNLPVPATPFVGRERELADVVGLVADDSLRLVTLTGPGGSGKTRLALQAAGALAQRFPHGVFWVPLAPLQDPELVLESASRALGAPNGLAEHIADSRVLLLFDNFEHVLTATSGVGELLAACPRLEILVTSREPLRLSGEQTYSVPPFAHEEAVGFFTARARSARPGFEVDECVSEICRRLDDLPLALELAAARVTALSPRQILERLERRLPLLTGGARDAPERQRTLRATIEWSHELLSPNEQRLFRRLAVFRGGCTLDAVESVCDGDLDTLQSLVEKSLLRFSSERYWMLETIRELAAEKLVDSGEADELARRHADHFVLRAEEAQPHLLGDPKEWLERLDVDHDNFRAALDHLAQTGETQLVLRLATALSGFWSTRGHLAEGARRLEEALSADARRTGARARALDAASRFAQYQQGPGRERALLEEALELHEELDDAHGAALARYGLATIAAGERDWEEARRLCERSVEELEALGDDFHTLAARRTLAWMHEELGDVARYRDLTEQNLELARKTGNRRIEARTLGALAMLALEDGRVADAVAQLSESYRIDLDLKFSIFLAVDLARFARIALVRGDSLAAARLLGRADAIREDVGFALESWAAEEREVAAAQAERALGRDAYARAREEGEAMTVEDAVALVLGPSVDVRE